MSTYCAKCRQPREIKDAKEVVLPNGKPALEGVCATCAAPLLKTVFPNACQ